MLVGVVNGVTRYRDVNIEFVLTEDSTSRPGPPLTLTGRYIAALFRRPNRSDRLPGRRYSTVCAGMCALQWSIQLSEVGLVAGREMQRLAP